MKKGIILKSVGGIYTVSTENGIYFCTLDGKIKISKTAPVCGDYCIISNDETSAHIIEILPRKNIFVRPAIANLDLLFVVASNAPPQTDPYLIDKISVIAAYKSVPMILLLNKSDIDCSDRLFEIYTACGYKVIRLSALTGKGTDEIRDLAKGKVCAFTGNSGIGKSSLINRLAPDSKLLVGDISLKTERGKQTTKSVELIPFYDGYIADTPGFSSFEIANIESIDKNKLQYLFPEISSKTGYCRFSDCIHINEPGCIVKQEMEKHRLFASRYESYKKIYSELSSVLKYK